MKPQLLLHICCAPDEAWVIKTLQSTHSLFAFFCNPNIAPSDEYELRRVEAERVAVRFDVPFAAAPFCPEEWEAAVAPWTTTPEGGRRCLACFELRLQATARFCREIGWPAFTTVMSISPHKSLAQLHQAGEQAARMHGCRYEAWNFRKKNGFAGSVALSKELGLYRQDYCGCRLSQAERSGRSPASSRTT